MTQPKTPMIPREIASPLSRLRLLIRAYVGLRGLALLAATLVALFWLTLAIDWLLEPGRGVRIALLVVAGLVACWVLLRQIGIPLGVPLTDRHMALLLERRDRRLGDRLLTVVELAGRDATQAGFNPHMLAHTGDEARALMPEVRPAAVLNFRPLLWSLAVAALSGMTIVALWRARPAAVQTWVQRSLLLRPMLWERDTRILVDGFPVDARGRRSVKVAIGGDLEVRARADTAHRIPSVLELSFVTQEGAVMKQNMTMQGTAVPGRLGDEYQEYFFQFKNVQNSISFDVTARRQQLFGKDDTVDDLWIDAVPSPDLSDLSLRCKYPSYLKRKDETLPVTGIMSIPEGTEVAVDAVATKDLVSADCQIAGAAARSVHVNVANGGRRFQFDLGAVRSDAAVAFTLHDTDGVSNRQPLRLQIRAVPDQPPEVDVRFAGIGKAITRQAILPLRGQVKDSHLVKAWFEFAAAKAKGTQQQTFEVPRDGQLTKAAGVALDVEDLILKPGGRFHVWVKAEDACPLPGTSHVGASPRIDFEVVTEQQLRGILEGTEHLLRGRHDGVMDSLRRDRDSLRRIETDAVEAPMAATAPAPSAGDQTAESRLQSRSAIRVESTLERATWSTHEVLEMAEQFERIVEELENNRVEHLDDLRSRLMDRIAAPLRRTASEEFPKLRQRLQSLRGSLADADRRRSAAAEAEKQLDVILHQLEQVRAEMIESEDLNNLVAQLRSVIEKQAEVGRTTRERQQQLKNELGQDLE